VRLAWIAALGLVALLALAACEDSETKASTAVDPPPVPSAAPVIALTGASFVDGGTLPKDYSCDNKTAKSPNILWHDVPINSKSLLVWANDVDARNFVHWMVFDIPPATSGLTAGISEEPILGDGSKQGKNTFGHFGYGPPCPPGGAEHHYEFRVYALDKMLGLQPGASDPEVAAAVSGHILGFGKMTVTYKREEG
jgi:Raf kinase inhibitor-like YbhB/YbcL family protein